MPNRTFHHQNQMPPVPHRDTPGAPAMFIRLMHEISDRIMGTRRRQSKDGIRTVCMNDGFDDRFVAVHEKLEETLYSFNTDATEAVQFTPIQWKRISFLVIQIGETLKPRQGHDGSTMFIFLDNGNTVVCSPSARPSGGIVRRTSVWKLAIVDFLGEIQKRLSALGIELASTGHTTNNTPLMNAGRLLITRGYTAMDISRVLDPDTTSLSRPEGTHPSLISLTNPPLPVALS